MAAPVPWAQRLGRQIVPRTRIGTAASNTASTGVPSRRWPSGSPAR
jgi:hypothetical protein